MQCLGDFSGRTGGVFTASRGVLEMLLWLRVPIRFVLKAFWVDLVLDFSTFSTNFGIKLIIFQHCFPSPWMYLRIVPCTFCVQP